MEIKGILKSESTHSGKINYSEDAGVSNAYVVSLGFNYHFIGQSIWFKAANSNTGASTLQLDGLSVISIKKNVNQDLEPDDIKSGQIVNVVYDGINFQISSGAGGSAQLVNLAEKVGEDQTNSYDPSGPPTYGSTSFISNGETHNEAISTLDGILGAIAPAPAGLLTSQSLTLSNATKYSAKLPSGLASDWYKDGVAAGDTVSDYVVDNTFSLATPDITTRFRCGMADLPQGVLSLKVDGTATDTYDLSNGVGTSGSLTVNDISAYPISQPIWAKANAYANITQSAEGHRSYAFSHPLAGETSTTIIRYDDVNTSPTFTGTPTVVEKTLIAKYLSGIIYYGQNSVLTVGFTATAGIFTKGYHASNVAQITMIPTAMTTNIQNPASTPAYNDAFVVSNLDLTLSVASRTSNAPYITFSIYKPNGASTSVNIYLARKVCTYGVVSTTTTESFFDESQRLVLNTDTGWDSTAALLTGNAQVRNGTLQYPYSTDYPGFSGNQEYQRWIYKNSASTGALVLTGITYTDINPYNTGDFNVFIQLDIDGLFYDLGRAVGDNNGTGDGSSRANSKGGRVSGSGSTINWSIGNKTTGTTTPPTDNLGRYRIIIVFVNTNHSITAISSS